MSPRTIRIFLFLSLFMLFLIPRIQKRFQFIIEPPLQGEFTPADKASFSFEGWFSGGYQKNFDKYYEENIGFRNSLIRIYNQVDFSLFHATHENVVVGKNGYLFQEKYLNAYIGADYIGTEKMDSTIQMITEVRDSLKQKGIYLFIVFAPTKVRTMKEYIPDFYARRSTRKTNYEAYKKAFKDHDITYLDFIDYFLKIKDTSSYPLYPEKGIHWSQYGMYLVVDSLVNFIQEKTNLDLNKFYCDSIQWSSKLRSTDYDLGALCNVLFDMPHNKMPYPVLRFEKNPLKVKPDVLAIGDSYYWNIITSDVPKYIFNGTNFWYYNHDVYADSLPQKSVVSLSTYAQDVEGQKIILVIQTESNLGDLGFGFFKMMSDAYSENALKTPLAQAEFAIRNNPEWLETVRKKAFERNVDLNVMIRTDAEWMVKQNAKKSE
jgi:hypothetical protein